MSVPSSGQLRLRADINQEINDNNTDTNVSLGTLSDDAGFDAPDTMSEFYGYTSFITPTVTQATTSNVYDVSMKLHGTMQSPSGGNVQYGWYFGTSATMLSNTFIHDGNNNGSTSTINFDYTKTGLSGSTTYYIWTAVRDLSGNVLASAALKTQATLASVSYSQGNIPSVNLRYEAVDSIGTSLTSQISMQYDHQIYGYTTASSASLSHTTIHATGVWEVGSIHNYAQKITYTSGTATANRIYPGGNFNCPTSPYGGLAEVRTVPAMPNTTQITTSYYNMSITAKTHSASLTGNAQFYDPWPSSGSTFSTSPQSSKIDANGGSTASMTGYIQFNA